MSENLPRTLYSRGFRGVKAATPPNTSASTTPTHTFFESAQNGKNAITATATQRTQFGLREGLLAIPNTILDRNEGENDAAV